MSVPKLAHPFFGGFLLLPEPLSRAINDVADLAEALAQLNPEHELLEYFAGFEPDVETVIESFQVRFGRPMATRTERYTEAG